jgi:hypothetical protein
MNKKSAVAVSLIFQAVFSGSANILIVNSANNSGMGTLRDQVAASKAGDTIQFDPSILPGTIVLNSVIVINHTLWVQGPGATKLTVSGNSMDRVFITGGTPVVISGMTIRDGLLIAQPGTDGSACTDGQAGGDAFGGGIVAGINNSDVLIISNCWVTSNTARGGHGGRGGDNFIVNCMPGKGGAGGRAFGGALYVFAGTAACVNCTFSDNHAIGGQGGDGGDNMNFTLVNGGSGGQGGDAQGGGADVPSPYTGYFTNCTFSGNLVISGAGGAGGTNAIITGGKGGDGGTGGCGALAVVVNYSVISCTVVSNSALGGAGGAGGLGIPPGSDGALGIGNAGGICAYVQGGCKGDLGNTIVAENFASTSQSNVIISPRDLGFNYIGDDDLFIPMCKVGSTRIGTVNSPLHPMLKPLAQNGGGLLTHAPMQGSPVIDYGYRFATTTDERGAPRPYGSPAINGGDGSDVGAFEFGSTPLGMSIGTNGGQVLIRWPAYYGDFALQCTTNLIASSAWSDVPELPIATGDFFVVTNTPIGAKRFYRLINR